MDKWQKKDIVWDRLICIYVENLYEGEKNINGVNNDNKMKKTTKKYYVICRGEDSDS